MYTSTHIPIRSWGTGPRMLRRKTPWVKETPCRRPTLILILIPPTTDQQTNTHTHTSHNARSWGANRPMGKPISRESTTTPCFQLDPHPTIRHNMWTKFWWHRSSVHKTARQWVPSRDHAVWQNSVAAKPSWFWKERSMSSIFHSQDRACAQKVIMSI